MQLKVLFIIFFALKIAAQLYLNLRNLINIRKHANAVPAEFEHSITEQEHTKAANYSCEKIRFSQFSIILDALLFIFWFPLEGLELFDSSLLEHFPVELERGVIFFVTFSMISYLLSLPGKLYSTFVIEEKYGFNKMTAKTFIVDQFKIALLSAVIALPLLYAVLKIIDKYESWWFIAWLLITGFQFLLLWAYPTIIAPLFNKFLPIEEGELKNKIDSLLEKTGFHSNGLFVMDASVRSSHGNAYFTGIGKKKRIVFFDTLLKILSPQEVQAVLAHELGHFKKKHILKSMIRSLVISLISFYILGEAYQQQWFYEMHFIQEQSSYMALMLFSSAVPIYTFFFIPISAWLSRKNEYEADAFAAQYSDANDLITSLVKLYKENASTLTPDLVYSKFYHSHPPAMERIAHLKKHIST